MKSLFLYTYVAMKTRRQNPVTPPKMANNTLKLCSVTTVEAETLSCPVHTSLLLSHSLVASKMLPSSVNLMMARETSATKGESFGKTCGF